MNVQHLPASSFEEWNSLIAPAIGARTLIMKPSSKAQNQDLIVIVTIDKRSPSALTKVLGKDARGAADDLVQKVFGMDKMDVNLTTLGNVENIQLFIDKEMLSSQEKIGFRNFSAEKSLVYDTEKLTDLLGALKINYEIVDFKAAQAKAEPAKSQESLGSKEEVGALIGITSKKEVDFSSWYTQVVTRTEMLDYYDISGCYILRPWAYNIWKQIQKFFGKEIEDLGVEDCYFPMFVSEKSLNREKDHVEGFSPEVAWVTKAGQSDLAEPIAIRPTSETVMYPYYASWLKSHRDLPLRLNQWCNVVRWEFKHPQPFLRTREFLWQEGHTAFATKEESDKEVLEILDLYRRVYEELLAVPVIPGKKSEKEKFAGGLYTTTVEGFIPTTGRAIQGATSHCLGQNFSKMFEILVDGDNEQGKRVHVWQNSWGITTRTIGVMVMIHGDDKGLVLPPKVASLQVVIIPTGITVKTSPADKEAILSKCREMFSVLKKDGLRVKIDDRENCTPGFKYNHWELKGVPIRLEVGPKDLKKNETRSVRRDTGASAQISTTSGFSKSIQDLLNTIQADLFSKAKKVRDDHLIRADNWKDFIVALNGKNLILAPWCETVECEDSVKDRSAKSYVYFLIR
jgi:prolyl-tRNA synthetase